MKNKSLIKIAKVLFGLALLLFLLIRTDLFELYRLLKGTNVSLILVAISLNFVVFVVNSYRWKVLLKASATRVSLSRLSAYTFIGSFFNAFLPSSIGGDVVRVIEVARHTKDKSAAFSSVFVDRLCGLGSLFLINFISLIFAYGLLEDISSIVMLELILLAVFLMTIFLFNKKLVSGLIRLFEPLLNIVPRLNLSARLKKVYGSLLVYKSEKGLVLKGVVISLVSRVIWIFVAYIVALSLDIHADVWLFFLFVPVVELIRTIPISVNGIGLREGAFVAFFGPYMGSSRALLVGLIFYALLYVNNILGGLLYLLRRI